MTTPDDDMMTTPEPDALSAYKVLTMTPDGAIVRQD